MVYTSKSDAGVWLQCVLDPGVIDLLREGVWSQGKEVRRWGVVMIMLEVHVCNEQYGIIFTLVMGVVLFHVVDSNAHIVIAPVFKRGNIDGHASMA